MTGAQLQSLLDVAGLSQLGGSQLIGISDRQMRRYLKGKAVVPRTVEYALRFAVSVDGREWIKRNS